MNTKGLARTITTTTTTPATSTSDSVIRTVNPATGHVINEYPIMTKEQINDKVKKSKEAFQKWRKAHSKRRDYLYELAKAESYSDLIEAGVVTVNNIVASDPRVPFGGIKKSGLGRELSRYGMLEFGNIKSIKFYDELVHYHHVE